MFFISRCLTKIVIFCFALIVFNQPQLAYGRTTSGATALNCEELLRQYSIDPDNLKQFRVNDWIEFVKSLGVEGKAESDLNSNEMSRIYAELPRELRQLLLQEIRNSYRLSGRYDDPLKIKLSPRRSLDLVLSKILEPYKLFKNNKQSDTVQNELLMDQWMNSVSVITSSPHPVLYARDLKPKLLILQKFLNQKSLRLPRNTRFVVFGSVPNGRGDLGTSDLDLNMRIGTQIPSDESDLAMKSAMAAMNTIVGQSLHYSMPKNGFGLLFASINSPVMIEITAKKVNLLIYEPSSTELDSPRSVRLDLW